MAWVDGDDAEKALPLLPKTKQYELGLSAGEVLRKIHSIPAPETCEDWEARYNRKTNRCVASYKKCRELGQTAPNDAHFLAYVEGNRHLLKNRPQCYLHGDYHVGNMIITPNEELSIIDWGRDDFGDPWEVHDKIIFSARTSPHFATGQLHGYFCGKPPEKFFKLMAFYISSNRLGSVGWAQSYGAEQVNFVRQQNDEILRWYDNMQTIIPAWYPNDFKI